MIVKNVPQLIGGTPLLQADKLASALNLSARLLLKLECFNPSGSVKDRAAYAMILDAEARGLLKEGSTIVEPTSGNTGIGLAAIAASRGYRIILTMPETMSAERQKLLKAYGAELVLTSGAAGMSGAIAKAKELANELSGAVVLQQFENPANPNAHRNATALEILHDTGNSVDVFIAGVGTGGTITGVGETLKAKLPKLHIVAVEPAESPVLSGGNSAPHGIQGIGAGFIPKILNTSIYDEVICIKTADACAMSRKAAKTEGILLGISSGAALFAAAVIARREEYKNAAIVAIMPDGGERYLSTPLFE